MMCKNRLHADSAKNGTSNKTRIGIILFRTFSAFSGQFRLFNRFRTGHIAGNYDVQERVACRTLPKTVHAIKGA
jgi:hypothetical protein